MLSCPEKCLEFQQSLGAPSSSIVCVCVWNYPLWLNPTRERPKAPISSLNPKSSPTPTRPSTIIMTGAYLLFFKMSTSETDFFQAKGFHKNVTGSIETRLYLISISQYGPRCQERGWLRRARFRKIFEIIINSSPEGELCNCVCVCVCTDIKMTVYVCVYVL